MNWKFPRWQGGGGGGAPDRLSDPQGPFVSFQFQDSELFAQINQLYNTFNSYFFDPTALAILFVVFLLYVIYFFSLGADSASAAPSSLFGDYATSSNTPSPFLIFFVIVFILIALVYVFRFNGFDWLTRLLKNPDKLPKLSLSSIGEVFNVPENKYTYDQAKTLCNAMGARLATYREIEDAYNAGGEWCNYGWSDRQMALFPTQEKTFDGLQKIPGHEHDCGRPGVNGGYMANPNLRFGVNCFGKKPAMNAEEKELMRPPSTCANDVVLEKRVDYWKNHLSQVLLSPFNYQSWSRM